MVAQRQLVQRAAWQQTPHDKCSLATTNSGIPRAVVEGG